MKVLLQFGQIDTFEGLDVGDEIVQPRQQAWDRTHVDIAVFRLLRRDVFQNLPDQAALFEIYQPRHLRKIIDIRERGIMYSISRNEAHHVIELTGNLGRRCEIVTEIRHKCDVH